MNCDEAIEIETIKEELNEQESVDDPLSIHQDNENKLEDLLDYDSIDIEEFKIKPGNFDINDTTNEDLSDQDNVNDEGNNLNVINMDEEVMDHNENVKEVEGKVVGKAFLSS